MGMVSFITQGRMGNFLFQCATAFAYAKKHGLEFSVPKRTSHEFWSPIYLHHLQNPNYNESLPQTIIKEQHFHYDPLPFEESYRSGNIVLHGYFQSEKYFDEYREEILQAFNFPYKLNEGVVSVHVRRTDYITYSDKHPEVTKEWYELAMSKFEGKRFVFYSDEISWCRENFGHRNDCSFSDGSIEQDLIEASCCEHQINSSSTYSWWIAWLNKNPNKIIYTPKLWFCDLWKDDYGLVNTSDIIPNNWIKM